ncbi:MAG: DUF3644 domain-containing protein [Acidimicrobiales bacterium]
MEDETEAEDDVELATRLLTEWDEGRGTSKSEIERREWGDGGAHGRRFDRFIRQTLGVATTKPSRQTDRIADLEAQLRRLGLVPEGRELDEWEHQLDHGRHAALAALRVWNDPAATFRTESFALLFVTAWNSIALAVLQREGEEWRDLDETGGPRMVAGRERALETGELIASAFGGNRHLGLRRNVEFWIGLRNQVAHRHLPALDVAILPQAQAGLLNLEGVLEDRFGPDFVLGSALSVPLQLTGFRDPGVLSSVKRLQSSLPLDVQSFLHDQASLNADLTDDPAYMLRVTFVPAVPASGRSPDAVAHFVKPGEVTEDLAQALKEYTVMTKVVKAERPHLIATQVVEAVSDRIPYRFTIRMHTLVARNLKARPLAEGDQTATDQRYCEYVTSVKRHLYSQAWVDRLVDELSTEDGFRRATNGAPEPRG